MLHIHLLGEFHLIHREEPVTGVNSARLQALLAYLLLHRDAPQRRQHLAFLFWPDTSEQQALTNLRTLLHRLRQALPMADHFLRADSQTVQWQPDAAYTLDVADFEAALLQAKTASDLERALQFYRGDLLPSCYDDWIPPLRQQLQQRAMGALARLMEMLEAERRYREAIAYGQQLLQFDPLNETTYRKLMHLHTVADDRPGALRVYQLCESTLRQELAVEPAQATRELYQRLRRATDEPSPPAKNAQAGTTLVGRKAEWKLLQDAWYAASAGSSHCVVISGEAGIGKTRLADELLGWVNRQGFTTAAAHCYAVEGALSYAPLATWLRNERVQPQWAPLAAVWLTELARLLPEIQVNHPDLPRPGALTEGWQRQRLFAALAQALLKAGVASLFFIDDLQWCDADTLAWLHYALHANTQASLLLVGTVRTEEMGGGQPLADWLAALQRDGQLTGLALGPLNADETASLAAQIARRSLTAEESAHLYRETEGNPLFVVESVRAGFTFGETRTAGGEAPTSFAVYPLPAKVQAVIHTRLARLSPTTRDLAGLAAAIGRSFSFEVLAKASRLDEESLVRCLNELEQQRIVQEQGASAYDFTHDKLREVTYNRLSAAQRRLLHRRIAEALEIVYRNVLDSISGQIATHYELAGDLEQAIPYYQRASEAAQRVYANADAIRYYQRALALLEGPGSHSPLLAMSLYEGLGDILHLTGQYDEARSSFQRALVSLPAWEITAQARLQHKMGNTWREQHAYEEALRAYELAKRTLGETNTDPDSAPDAAWWQEWVQVTLEVMHAYYWLGRVREGEELLPTLQDAVAQHGTPDQRVAYAKTIAWQEFRRNRSVATAETVAAFRSALAAHLESGDQDSIPAVQFQLGFVMLWSGDPAGAITPIQDALRLAEQTGDITLQTRCVTYLAIAFRLCDQIEESRRYVLRTLEVTTTVQMPEYMGIATANQAWIAWRAGDLTQTQEFGHAALELWRRLPTGHGSTLFQWLALFPLLAAALRQEQLVLAIDHARALLDPAQQRLPDTLTASLEQAVQAWDRGDRVTAHTRLHQAANLAQQMHYL